MRGSGVVDESVEEDPVVDDVDEVVVDDGAVVPEGGVDTDEPEDRLDELVLSVEDADELDELDELDDELESVGSARATPGIVATAVPTPRATASAPTRPI